MDFRRRVSALVCSLVALVAAGGCNIPGRMAWAPDASRGTIQVDGRAVVMDRQGRVLADLGDSVAGFCWSPDSNELYLATVEPDDGTVPLTEVRRDWLRDSSAYTPGAAPGLSMIEDPLGAPATPAPTTAPATTRALNQQPLEYLRLAVSVRRDGKTMPLFRLRSPCPEARLLASPDGSWLVVGTSMGNWPVTGLAMPDLYAFSLRSGRLFAVAPWVTSACFTGPDRLAFARCAALSDALGLYAILFEATLAEDRKPAPDGPPDARALLELMPLWTGTVHPAGDDLLLTAARRGFPRPVRDGSLDPGQYDLFRWSRHTGRLGVVARNAGPWFLPSPGARRVLFRTERTGNAARRARTALAVVDADGGDRRNLHADGVPVDDRHFAFNAMEPTWQGEEHVVLAGPLAEAPPPAAGEDKGTRCDLTLYRLAARGRLQRVRTLSRDWDPSIKPYTHGSWLSTRPSTRPAGKAGRKENAAAP